MPEYEPLRDEPTCICGHVVEAHWPGIRQGGKPCQAVGCDCAEYEAHPVHGAAAAPRQPEITCANDPHPDCKPCDEHIEELERKVAALRDRSEQNANIATRALDEKAEVRRQRDEAIKRAEDTAREAADVIERFYVKAINEPLCEPHDPACCPSCKALYIQARDLLARLRSVQDKDTP